MTTEAQQHLLRQLHELILEKYGTLRRFCNTHHYKYMGIRRILAGETSNFDDTLYHVMRQQCLDRDETVSEDILLLQKIIALHYPDYKTCCRELGIRIGTITRLFQSNNAGTAEFKKIAYAVYRSYLMKQHADIDYNKHAPGKYLNRQALRIRNLKAIRD